MTLDQVRLVRGTLDVFLAVSSGAADRFYDRLFELEPQARPMFPSDLRALKLKLMNTLATIVGALDRPDMFRSILMHLGQHHGALGVRAEHYAAGHVALMDGLLNIIGARCCFRTERYRDIKSRTNFAWCLKFPPRISLRMLYRA